MYHLRAYVSCLLVLGFLMDMVLAANDAPQQAIADPARAPPGNYKPWKIGVVVTSNVLLVIFILPVWYRCSLRRRLHKIVWPRWEYEGGLTYTRISLIESVNATKNFDEARAIGGGVFGKVYLGTLNDGYAFSNMYHLRAYISRLLVPGFLMDMVLAANDAPQQAITDPSRAPPGNYKPWVIGGVVTGAVFLLAIFNLLVWYLCSRRRRLHKSVRLSKWEYEGGPTYTRFSFSEIVNATKNFDEARVIGEGGFGKVYLGTLNDGTTVAIKRGSRCYQQGEKEFRAEIAMLLRLRHFHLISLLGCCSENSEMVLVYEYMDNGTLRQHLYGSDNPQPTNQPLTWTQRIKIAIHAASGLHYLHTGFQQPIIHRDVKSSNILLDRNFIAKVSDFGLSRERPAVDNAQLSSAVKGSFGYLDPEYYKRHRLTEKSDVYSFGVVLFEILFGRPALDKTRPTEQQVLSEWALHCYRNNILHQIIDPFLQDQILPECLEIYVQTAITCLADKGKDRLSMGDVLVSLQHALALQESDDVFLQMPPEL